MGESDGRVIERLTRENVILTARVMHLEAMLRELGTDDPLEMAVELEKRGARIAQLERLLGEAGEELMRLRSHPREY